MSKRPPKKKNIQPIRNDSQETQPGDSAVAVEEPPETPPPAAVEPPKPTGPPFKRKENPVKTSLTFFDRVSRIELADWGTRAKIKVYRLEPIIDRTRGSEYKFVQIYHEPIDENKIKIDHGSGRYRLYLNVKSAGQKDEKEIDMIEFDVLDIAFPPRIPAGEWVDDPRNKKWAWARPAGAAGGPPVEPPSAVAAVAANQFLEGVKVAGEIRKELKGENPPPPPPAAESTSLAGTLQLVTTIMGMKAENPMNEVYRDEMKALRDELKEERAENRRLMERRNGSSEGEKKFGLKEAIAELKDVIPTVKDLLPQVSETVRAGRTNWLDVAQTVAPGIIDWAGKIALAVASRQPIPPQQNGQQHPQQQIAGPQQPNAGVTPPSGGSAPPQQQQEVPKFVQFLSQPIAFDAFRRYFDGYKKGEGQTGGDFASWVFDGGGIEHMKEARAMGSANIMAFLKRSQAWILFQADEAKLVEFVDQALAWMPPPDDEDGDDEDEDEAVDLTRKGV